MSATLDVRTYVGVEQKKRSDEILHAVEQILSLSAGGSHTREMRDVIRRQLEAGKSGEATAQYTITWYLDASVLAIDEVNELGGGEGGAMGDDDPPTIDIPGLDGQLSPPTLLPMDSPVGIEPTYSPLGLPPRMTSMAVIELDSDEELSESPLSQAIDDPDALDGIPSPVFLKSKRPAPPPIKSSSVLGDNDDVEFEILAPVRKASAQRPARASPAPPAEPDESDDDILNTIGLDRGPKKSPDTVALSSMEADDDVGVIDLATIDSIDSIVVQRTSDRPLREEQLLQVSTEPPPPAKKRKQAPHQDAGPAPPKIRKVATKNPKPRLPETHTDEHKRVKKKKKEEAVAEMKVILDTTILNENDGHLVVQDIKAMKEVPDSHVEFLPLPIQRAILFRRKKENGEFKDEPFIMLRMSGQTFLAMIFEASSVQSSMDHILNRIKEKYPTKRVTLIVESLKEAIRERVNKYNAQYSNNVRGGAAPVHGIRISDQDVSEKIVGLQLLNKVNVHVTESAVETAYYLSRALQSIATLPYKPKPAFETFCAEATVRAKAQRTAHDAWKSQLMQLHGVSEQIATSIVEKYPTIRALIEIYENGGLTEREKQDLLKDIEVNYRGGNQRLGPALSKQIFQSFTAE